MANFFIDNKDLTSIYASLDLRDVVLGLENNFSAAEQYADAPRNHDEALENFQSALTILGDIAANVIKPRSAEIDATGATFADGRVAYAPQTEEARKLLAELGFMGVMLPREHGGSNYPVTVYMMMIEIVSRADASLMTLFGYQDVGELIARFGTSSQAAAYLPKLASGEHIGAIVLSEPGAGSDLQSIRLAARQNENGEWILNGTKHFISNGCGDVLMVLARSEPNVSNIFGLSLFVCRRSEKVRVTRLEEKMGLHGSPTCELHFDDAPAELIGQRRLGLTRYILESLNQARFAVVAQAIGIAEASYQAALAYARERVQFGSRIYDFPAVSEMLIDMSLGLESSRALLYEGAMWLDRKNRLEHQLADRKNAESGAEEIRDRYRAAARMVSLLSPMVKYVATETANRICYDAQQIFGGMGYIRETGLEQLVRDVRITTIYEGTSQIQVAASVKLVMADALGPYFDAFHARLADTSVSDLLGRIRCIRELFQECIALLSSRQDESEVSAAARSVVDTYSRILAACLLTDQAQNDARKRLMASRYILHAQARAEGTLTMLRHGMYEDGNRRDVICGPP